jgi:type IV pilus assembly protein PilY1
VKKPANFVGRPHPIALACLSVFVYASQLNAQVPNISQTPITLESAVEVKNNLIFVLDDSGSMGRSHIPDDMSADQSKHCVKNAFANPMYFNPDARYAPPVLADGTRLPDRSYTNAPTNGYNTATGQPTGHNRFVNLSTSFKSDIFYPELTNGGTPSSTDTAQAAYYYRYTGTSPIRPALGVCYPNTSYTKVEVNTLTVADKQNFANWFSYYRTRMQIMKAAVGESFFTLDNRFRIAYTTINTFNFPAAGSANYQTFAPFEGAAKTGFYTKLYGIVQDPNNSTPLRHSLTAVGKLYEGSLAGAQDPIEYSCQRNYTVLSTDGFWNEYINPNPNIALTTNTDSAAPRPFYDGGASVNAFGTLADIAYHYYVTDLRTTGPFAANNVPASPSDPATHQHMTTFTVGLGLDGNLIYRPDYDTADTGDYRDIVNGTKNWPPINPSGSNNNSNSLAKVDDLWHAAVNGRGKYISASDPQSLSLGLSEILNIVDERTAAQASAATSNPNISAGDNFLFSSKFESGKWVGDLSRRTINLATGALSAPEWSAQALLDTRVDAQTDTRTIHTFAASAPNKLRPFMWGQFTSQEQANLFTNQIPLLRQYAQFNTSKRALMTGNKLVNYLRGQRGYEISVSFTDINALFRKRAHVLGDIVNSGAAYVKKPKFKYQDAGYAAFAASQSSRTPMVYVGANDGMLHAFNGGAANADGGKEVWAYIPSFALPNLYKLADTTYGSRHSFFIDGSPVSGDISCNGNWKTLLVGGMNAGGRGYYALDVTTPDAPQALWEFTDTDIGLTFGNPVITKNKTGQWVVMVTSGYNNGSTTGGNGQGHLYIINACTGQQIHKISTGAGSASAPSGLAKITAYAENTNFDNTTKYVYAGDFLGNVWRFDPDQLVGNQVVKLASLGRPVITRPELGKAGVPNGTPVVLVGTGAHLQRSHALDTVTNTFYAIKDRLQPTGYMGDFRTVPGVVQRTFANITASGGQAARTVTPLAQAQANFSLDDPAASGWFIDLPVSGERANTNPSLDLGTLTFVTNIPAREACAPGGSAWLNFLDYKTGGPVATSENLLTSVPVSDGNTLATDTTVFDAGGQLFAGTPDATGAIDIDKLPKPSSLKPRRISWREWISRK